jgi:pimeloyl-ACP methyl ester carboxylesterase
MPTVGVHRATIYYQVHGEGPPVVLAHGAGGNTLSWYQQVPYFAQRYRVINFDHRSFGRSECDRADLDFKHFADDLLALLDAEAVERAAVVTHDMGGFSGLRLALEHPDRVSCLVLCNTTGGVMTEGFRQGLDRASLEYSRRGPTPEQVLPVEFIERNPGSTSRSIRSWSATSSRRASGPRSWRATARRRSSSAGGGTGSSRSRG